VASLTILNSIRQFETTNGALKFPELAMNPPMLVGRNVYECSGMDATYDPAATASNLILLYGDFKQFVITDRIGSRVELIQNLVGANQRPTGQRGAFLWARVGSDSLVDNAFRVLNIATTA
jgi:HK97 family phage major capsid protein